MPSEWETFGLVAIEAMACGDTVPACSAHGSFPELRHEHDGVLFEPGNRDAFVAAFRAVDTRSDALRWLCAECTN